MTRQRWPLGLIPAEIWAKVKRLAARPTRKAQRAAYRQREASKALERFRAVSHAVGPNTAPGAVGGSPYPSAGVSTDCPSRA